MTAAPDVSTVAQRFFLALQGKAQMSASVYVDFGIDNDDIFRRYLDLMNGGELTLKKLNDAICDGPALSKLLGMQIVTSYDCLTQKEENVCSS